MKNFGKALAATAGLLGLLAGAPAVAGPTLPVATCNTTDSPWHLRQRSVLPTYGGSLRAGG